MADPAGVLGEIVSRKRADLAVRFDGVTIDALRSRAVPTMRSLHAALSRPGIRFVMEVKRASPSGGPLRPGADPAAIARSYAPAAHAISVLTDTPYFGGSPADLEAVRKVFDGPVLAKDFFIDPRQIVEARIHGADAVLVMLSVLDDAEAAEMMAEARRFGMDCLVEAHDESEVARALALGAAIIGINNRDLRTLEVDLGVTERLAPLVPADRVLVSESGIASRGDVDRLGRYADAVLVGSALMRAPDPGAAARVLAFGRVKVCGITDAGDLAAAAQAGACWVGLVLVPETPRALSIDAAARLAADALLPLVGVFRDSEIDQVADAARRLGLAAVQLHGSEDARYLRTLRARLADACELWAAIAVGEGGEPGRRPDADRALFDTAAGGRFGGTGRAFDWSRLAGRDDLGDAILAGGLCAANAAAASRAGAYALDVGSGVESHPGRKDPARLDEFFAALRPSSRQERASC